MVIPLEVAIDKQGRIVMPKEIREKYGLSEGEKLELLQGTKPYHRKSNT